MKKAESNNIFPIYCFAQTCQALNSSYCIKHSQHEIFFFNLQKVNVPYCPFSLLSPAENEPVLIPCAQHVNLWTRAAYRWSDGRVTSDAVGNHLGGDGRLDDQCWWFVNGHARHVDVVDSSAVGAYARFLRYYCSVDSTAALSSTITNNGNWILDTMGYGKIANQPFSVFNRSYDVVDYVQ